MNSYYSLLGVEPGAGSEAIDKAYQHQRERYSTQRVAEMDENIQQLARQRLAEIEHAYAVLSDPQQRQQYDAQLGTVAMDDPTASAQAVSSAQRMRQGISRREAWYAAGGIVVALVLVAVIWGLTDRSDIPAVGEVNRPAPSFTLPALQGGEIDLEEYRGQVVLVNFWGTWCEPCRRETPALQAAYEQLRDEGFVVIGVNMTEDELVQNNSEDDIRAFADQYNVTYPIALDTEGEVSRAFRVYPLPTSFFIDPEGTIRYMRVSEITADEVVALFNQLMQESTAQQ
jgi:peroxiredoxin